MDGIVLHDGRRVWGEVHVDREVGTPRLEVLYPAARDPETVVQVYPLEPSALPEGCVNEMRGNVLNLRGF